MKHGLVNWFEIPVTDLERAKNFYQKVLSVTLEDLDMEAGKGAKLALFPMPKEGELGTPGALVLSENYVPSDKGTVVYLSCEDLNVEAEKVEVNGGKIVFPKMSIGENGFIAHFIDTEGNRVALHSMK